MYEYDSGLYSLLENNQEAQQFFASLPDYVKDGISQRASNIHSLEGLRHYADNLLQGDR